MLFRSDGKKEGKGIIFYGSSSPGYHMKYDGEWKNDKREGKGTLFRNGRVEYEGFWKNDKQEG